MTSPAGIVTEFQVPTYSITFGPDGTLQFQPPQGSRELAIALSVQFPFQRTLEEKLREASLLFLRSQHQATSVTEMQHPAIAPPLPIPTQSVSQLDVTDLVDFHGTEDLQKTTTQSQQIEPGAQETTASPTSSHQLGTNKRSRKPRVKESSQPEGSFSPVEHVFNSQSGDSMPKRTRRTFATAEAVEVFANRGNICDYHKAKRTKVSVYPLYHGWKMAG
jgi:hypothetical protein